MFVIFFFQAEDGIRDYKVTGVQTCALPISCTSVPSRHVSRAYVADRRQPGTGLPARSNDSACTSNPLIRPSIFLAERSEERRVGKECSARSAPSDWKEEAMRRGEQTRERGR